MPRIITDPFFRKLNERLEEEINRRIFALKENGATVRSDKGMLIDPVNTAIKYEKDVAVIKAYQDIIEVGFEIDREVFGVKHKYDDGDE